MRFVVLCAALMAAFTLAVGCFAPTEDFIASPYRQAGGPGGGGGFGGGMGGGDFGVCFGAGEPDPQAFSDSPGAVLPLPVTGSTLFVSRSTGFAVASNPNAPSISFIHVGTTGTNADPLRNFHVTLNTGDWPYKQVEDSSGTFHILLRGTGELLSVNPATPSSVRRTALCKQPRGLVFNQALNVLHAACAEGLVLTVDPATGAVTSRVDAPNDLRDVVVKNAELFVTRFRSAELRRVGAPLNAAFRPAFGTGAFGQTAPAVAWKSTAWSGGVAMVHQRAVVGNVVASCSGYGGGSNSIVTGAVTLFGTDGGVVTSVVPCGSGLPVDFALTADEKVLAVVEAGRHNVTLTPFVGGAVSDVDGGSCTFGRPAADGGFRPVSVGFTADDRMVVQTEEPALHVYAPYIPNSWGVEPGAMISKTGLPGSPVVHTGHRLFHDSTATGNISCAGCHPEGQDDGHVWSFFDLGVRRTQNLAGGISGTAPFHWNGDMTTFATLTTEVMEKRMSGPKLDAARQSAMLRWIDSVPAAKAPPKDAAAVSRGKALFELVEVGCSGCHSGTTFTNNTSANVGTGGVFQVPTLMGLGTRAPFIHNGCAKTLAERFGPCGGGDMHGRTSQLSSAQIADLVAYLATL